jgi:hypothetical protein
MPCRRMAPSLSRSALEDTRAHPDVDHDGRAVRWYLFTLIAHSPQLLPTGHVAASELSCARRRELGSQSTWRSQSYHGPWWRELEPRRTRGPRAGLCQEREPLPWSTWWSWSCRGPWWWELELRGTWRLRSCPVLGYESHRTSGHVRPSYLSSLTWSLYTGVPGLQGIDNIG